MTGTDPSPCGWVTRAYPIYDLATAVTVELLGSAGEVTLRVAPNGSATLVEHGRLLEVADAPWVSVEPPAPGEVWGAVHAFQALGYYPVVGLKPGV